MSEQIIPESDNTAVDGIRLNKFLALCGYESRRAADRLIAEKRVEINGHIVETPGVRVQPNDFVKVDGHRAEPKEEIVLLLNKPRGFVCSRATQGKERTVYALIPARYNYVNYVGRLDSDSEGLVLFTNNGTLSQQLSHPRTGIEKEYWVTLDQNFDNSVLIQLLKGLKLPEGQAKAKYVARLSPRRACVVLEQGLKRQVRQMFACMGLTVKKLVRVRIGSLWGGELEPGNIKVLSPEEISLASKNPAKRRQLIGVRQAFAPRNNEATLTSAPDANDDENYVFDPADFETGDDETERGNTLFDTNETYDKKRRPPQRAHRPQGRPQSRPQNYPRNNRNWRENFQAYRNNGEGGKTEYTRKPFGDKPFAQKTYGERQYGNKPFTKKPSGEKRFGDKPFAKKTYGERQYGDKPFGRKPFGEKPQGDRPFDKKSYGERQYGSKPFTKKPFGEKRFGDKPFAKKPYGERQYGNKPFGRKPFGDKPEGDRPFDKKPYGERQYGSKPFTKKPFGEKRFGDKQFGDRPHNNRSSYSAPRGDRFSKNRSGWADRRSGGNPRFNNRPPREQNSEE